MKVRLGLILVIALVTLAILIIPSPSKSLIPYKVVSQIEPDSDLVIVLETGKFNFLKEDSNFIVKNSQGSVSFKPFTVEENSQLDVLLENWTSTQENVYIYPEGCNYLQIRIHDLKTKVSSFKCVSELINYEV